MKSIFICKRFIKKYLFVIIGTSKSWKPCLDFEIEGGLILSLVL